MFSLNKGARINKTVLKNRGMSVKSIETSNHSTDINHTGCLYVSLEMWHPALTIGYPKYNIFIFILSCLLYPAF